MRFLPFALVMLPNMMLADEIALTSKVTNVTVYPQGATITREVMFQAPKGSHKLVLTDLPATTPTNGLRISVTVATMGPVTVRQDYVPPRDAVESEALIAAKAEVTRLEHALSRKQDEKTKTLLAVDAAEARIQFLRQIGETKTQDSADMAALRDMSRMIGEETLAAQQEALNAKITARSLDPQLEALTKELEQARQAVRALVPEQDERAYVAVAIEAGADNAGTLSISYAIEQANWQPVYDMHLKRGETPLLTVSRGAFVSQYTGENWRDVAVTLSTVRPSGQTRPTEPWPQLLRIEDPAAPQPKVVMRSMAQADMAEEAPVIMAETAAQASFDGPSVTYVYPGTVDVASDADAVRLALGEIALAPKIRAVAVPSRDTTAYLMAGFTNDTAELILPTSAASFYLDGTYVGTQYTDMIAAGADAKLSFGPIEGVQLERTVLSKSEGDRGVISKSNQQREQVRIDVTNLTSEPWDVRLLDQVPYSEQDDLLIQWSATPKVSEQDVDGKRGILAWDFALPAGASQQIMLDQTIDWPIDKVLR